MKAIRVRIDKGRISGKAPAGLPDGEVELCLAAPEEKMSAVELRRLNDALARAFESVKTGRFRRASEVIRDLAER
jgi:hypothetical protein